MIESLSKEEIQQYKKFVDALETARNAQILAYGETISYKCKFFRDLERVLDCLEYPYGTYVSRNIIEVLEDIRLTLERKSRKSSTYRAYSECFLPEEAILDFIDFILTIIDKTTGFTMEEYYNYSSANYMLSCYIRAQLSHSSDTIEKYIAIGSKHYKNLFG